MPVRSPRGVTVSQHTIDVLNFETENGILTVAGRFAPDVALLSDVARVVVSPDAGFETTQAGDWVAVNTTAAGVYCFKCESPPLPAGERWFWRVEVQSNPGVPCYPTHYMPTEEPFVDVPVDGPESFRVLIRSCTTEKLNSWDGLANVVESDHKVHLSMIELMLGQRGVEAETPDTRRTKYIDLGDLTYSDYTGTTAGAQLDRMWIKTQNTPQGPETGAPQPYRAKLAWQMPWRYFPDDHDTGGDNAAAFRLSGAADQRDTIWASLDTYRAIVAHGELHDTHAVHQSWVEGRIGFIGLDVRAYRVRSAEGTSTDPAKTMLGADQLEWLLDKVEEFDADPDIVGIVVMSPSAWIAPGDSGGNDSWGKHQYERELISDAWSGDDVTRTRVLTQIVMVTGDCHASRMDDGTNSDYSTSGLAFSMPVSQACSTNPPNYSNRSGPYSFDDDSLYGVDTGLRESGCITEILVDDDGGPTVTLTMRNLQADATTGALSIVNVGNGDMTVTLTLGAAVAPDVISDPATVATPVVMREQFATPAVITASATVAQPTVSPETFITPDVDTNPASVRTPTVSQPTALLEFTSVTSGSGSIAGGSVATSSVTPTADTLHLLVVAAAAAGGETLTGITAAGAGLTWVSAATTAYATRRRLSVFRALGSSPSTGALTIACTASGTMTTAAWHLIEVANASVLGTDGSGAVAQAATNALDNQVALAATITNSPSSIDALVTFLALETDIDATPDADFTAIGSAVSESTNVRRVEAAYSVEYPLDTTPTWTWSGFTGAAAVTLHLVGNPTGDKTVDVDALDAAESVGSPTVERVGVIDTPALSAAVSVREPSIVSSTYDTHAPWGDPYVRDSWPGPTTVAAGVVGLTDEGALSAWGASYTISTDQTITDKLFTSGVTVNADVVFENCAFEVNGTAITIEPSNPNAWAQLNNCKIERPTLSTTTTDVPIRWSGFGLWRCEVAKYCSILSFGSKLGRRQVVEDCYIHSMSENRHEGNHREVIHLEYPNSAGFTATGNWLEFRGSAGTANFSLGNPGDGDDHIDVLFENNVIGGRGNHCFDIDTAPYDKINVRFIDNWILTDYPLVDNGDVGTAGWTGRDGGSPPATTDTFYDRSPPSASRWLGTWGSGGSETSLTISGNKWWNADTFGRVQGGSADRGDPTCDLDYGL